MSCGIRLYKAVMGKDVLLTPNLIFLSFLNVFQDLLDRTACVILSVLLCGICSLERIDLLYWHMVSLSNSNRNLIPGFSFHTTMVERFPIVFSLFEVPEVDLQG